MKRKSFLVCLLVLCHCFSVLYAQSLSDSLSGTYQLTSENGLYNAFVFNGAGRVTVKSTIEDTYDFFQINDTVIIYPDKDVFLFRKLDDQTLVGLNIWVNGQVFKKTEEYLLDSLALTDRSNHLANFYAYYLLCERSAPNLSTYLALSSDAAMKQKMHLLCEAGFSKACLTMANAMMANSPTLISSLLRPSEKKEKVAPDKEVLFYFAKALRQHDTDAFAQLAAYFLLLGDNEKAYQLFTKGCDEGIKKCCFSLAGLESLESEDGAVY